MPLNLSRKVGEAIELRVAGRTVIIRLDRIGLHRASLAISADAEVEIMRGEAAGPTAPLQERQVVVVSRRRGESLHIGNSEVVVREIEDHRVRLAVHAPAGLHVVRGECVGAAVRVLPTVAPAAVAIAAECPRCDGTGEVYRADGRLRDCSLCAGTGSIDADLAQIETHITAAHGGAR